MYFFPDPQGQGSFRPILRGFSKRGLLIKDHEQVNADRNGSEDSDCHRVGMPEYNPQPDPPPSSSLRTWDSPRSDRSRPRPTALAGRFGAGVPCPVQPKSHTQRRATANPSTDGMAASQRQRAAPALSTADREGNHPSSRPVCRMRCCRSGPVESVAGRGRCSRGGPSPAAF